MLESQDLAARFVPLEPADRPKILKRLPRRKGERSQLVDTFDGAWYVHKGPLILGESYDNTLNLVVDGDLTVRGTLDDGASSAHLVVLGDLRCQSLLSRHLTVVTGSLYCAGLVYADHNDYAFEVWGDRLEARALVLTDKSARLPADRSLEYVYDDDSHETQGDGDALSPHALAYLDEDGSELSEADRRSGATVERVRPRIFEEMRQIVRRDQDVFRKPLTFGASERLRVALLNPNCPESLVTRALDEATLHIDAALSPGAAEEQLARLSASEDESVLIAVASHPRTPLGVLEELAGHSSSAVRGAVAHHPDLPAPLLAVLARDRAASVRQHVAGCAGATTLLAGLARDRSAEVRRAAASHSDLQDSERLVLLRDPDPGVRRRSLRYLPPTSEWFDRLLEEEDADLIAWAIENRTGTLLPRTFTEAAQGLFDPRVAVRRAWLRRLTPVHELVRFFHQNAERFIKDESPEIRRFLALSARHPDVLFRLAADPSDEVRQEVLANLTIPAAILEAEGTRLCGRPSHFWSVHDANYVDHISRVHRLLKHPRLPAEVVTTIHRVYPVSYRLEPHPNMTLAVALVRAESLTPSLASRPDFVAWKEAASDEDQKSPILVALLEGPHPYLQSAARMNPQTPIEALLRQARRLDPSDLASMCVNPGLSAKTAAGAALLQCLLNQDDERVAVALAANPDVPLRSLREAAQKCATASDRARVTAWQAHGELLRQ